MLHSKHIAAYLPHKVFAAQPRLSKKELYPIYGLKHSSYAGEWIVYLDDSRHGDYQSAYLKGITLALRPLDDLLKKSFIHNTEEIIPNIELPHLDFEWLVNSTDPYKLINRLGYEDFEKLLSWHIDVFGLIHKEGAIDMYTLEE